MKHTNKIAILTLAFSGLLSGMNVLAEATGAAAAAGRQEPATSGPEKCGRREGKEQRLETLKADLKLNPGQEAAWTEWADRFKGDRQGREGQRKNLASWASLPAPERMEKMLAFSKEHVAKLEALLAATKTFYATLSPGQRPVFDKGFDFGHHGGFGKRWHK